jgi:hypothetical protein
MQPKRPKGEGENPGSNLAFHIDVLPAQGRILAAKLTKAQLIILQGVEFHGQPCRAWVLPLNLCNHFLELKKLLRNITVYLMAATFFVASTGLSVHHLYCYCKGEMVTSLFRPNEPCEMASAKTPAKNCCKGSTCSSENPGTQHDCSDCTSEFVKLDLKYLPNFFDLKLQDFIIPQTVPFQHSELAFIQTTQPHQELDLPPPPAGKALLPWIQSFLC